MHFSGTMPPETRLLFQGYSIVRITKKNVVPDNALTINKFAILKAILAILLKIYIRTYILP